MKNGHDPLNQKLRRLCRDINNRADDREKLQTLVIQLQEVLGDRRETRVTKFNGQQDNPFDKIMVG